MNQDTITGFWAKTSDEGALRTEFDALMGGAESVPAAEIVTLGAKHGFAFTLDELKVSMMSAAGAELSDKELEEVAGGLDTIARKITPTDLSYKITPETKPTSIRISSGIISF